MRSLWRWWQTLAILGRMVSQSRCPRMRELAIGRSGGLGSMQREENIGKKELGMF